MYKYLMSPYDPIKFPIHSWHLMFHLNSNFIATMLCAPYSVALGHFIIELKHIDFQVQKIAASR